MSRVQRNGGQEVVNTTPLEALLDGRVRIDTVPDERFGSVRLSLPEMKHISGSSIPAKFFSEAESTRLELDVRSAPTFEVRGTAVRWAFVTKSLPFTAKRDPTTGETIGISKLPDLPETLDKARAVRDTYVIEESKQTVTCKDCGGTGQINCDACHGQGMIQSEISADCSSCNGTGRRGRGNCGTCKGTGRANSLETNRCGKCSGRKQVPCAYCEGAGKRLQFSIACLDVMSDHGGTWSVLAGKEPVDAQRPEGLPVWEGMLRNVPQAAIVLPKDTAWALTQKAKELLSVFDTALQRSEREIQEAAGRLPPVRLLKMIRARVSVWDGCACESGWSARAGNVWARIGAAFGGSRTREGRVIFSATRPEDAKAKRFHHVTWSPEPKLTFYGALKFGTENRVVPAAPVPPSLAEAVEAHNLVGSACSRCGLSERDIRLSADPCENEGSRRA
jgi:hypothetical protein